MDLYEHAKREVELFKEHMKANDKTKTEPLQNKYFEGCADSALEAFEVLTKQGHSGMSIGVTMKILNDLVNNRPLVALTGNDVEWDEVTLKGDTYKMYQNNRRSSLFKKVYPNGTIEYSDMDRIVCYDENSPSVRYSNGIITKAILKEHPIEFPYSAFGVYTVEVESCLTDRKNGDYDTMRVKSIKHPDGLIEIRDDLCWGEKDHKMLAITFEEFKERKNMAQKRAEIETQTARVYTRGMQ